MINLLNIDAYYIKIDQFSIISVIHFHDLTQSKQNLYLTCSFTCSKYKYGRALFSRIFFRVIFYFENHINIIVLCFVFNFALLGIDIFTPK